MANDPDRRPPLHTLLNPRVAAIERREIDSHRVAATERSEVDGRYRGKHTNFADTELATHLPQPTASS